MNKSSDMKVGIKLLGRDYFIACAKGEEKRLNEIVRLVESKLEEVAKNGGNASESRLFLLTSLLLADELIEAKNGSARLTLADEELIIAAVDHLTQRVASLAQEVGHA